MFQRYKEQLENGSQSEDDVLLSVPEHQQPSCAILHQSPSDLPLSVSGPSTLSSVNQELAKYEAEMKKLEEEINLLREEVSLCERGRMAPSDLDVQGTL